MNDQIAAQYVTGCVLTPNIWPTSSFPKGAGGIADQRSDLTVARPCRSARMRTKMQVQS
jgi:hypothetical protein